MIHLSRNAVLYTAIMMTALSLIPWRYGHAAVVEHQLESKGSNRYTATFSLHNDGSENIEAFTFTLRMSCTTTFPFCFLLLTGMHLQLTRISFSGLWSRGLLTSIPHPRLCHLVVRLPTFNCLSCGQAMMS